MMKKLLVLTLVMMACNGLFAQVVLESGDLKSVTNKAKTENKLIMIIGSATW